ncbi:MAG: dephospho-CoA kinase [Syntrophorhabdaceae bacterium]
MITIGITGIIGSGKSTASALLKKKGIPVIDLDALAKKTLTLAEVHRDIEKELGPGFTSNGEINIEKLRDAVFVDKEKLKKLETITHPRILNQMWQAIKGFEKSGQTAVAIDGPLLFETGLYKEFDKTVVVTAGMDFIRERLKIRGMDAQDIEKRISHQIPLGEKEKSADYVLLNNGTKEDLEREIDKLMERIKNGR